MGKATWVKASGEWKEVKNVWENVGGTWKEKVVPKINITDNWKECIGYGKTIFGIHDNYSISAMTYDGKIIWTQTFPYMISSIFIDNIGDLCALSIFNMYKLNKSTGEITLNVTETFSTYSSTIYQVSGVEVDNNNNYIIGGCIRNGYAGMRKYDSNFNRLWTAEQSISGFSNPSFKPAITDSYILAGSSGGIVFKYNFDGTYVSNVLLTGISTTGVLTASGHGSYGIFGSSSSGATAYIYKVDDSLSQIYQVTAPTQLEYIKNIKLLNRTFVGNTLKELLPDGSIVGSWVNDADMQFDYDSGLGYFVVITFDATNSILTIKHYDSGRNLVETIIAEDYIFFKPYASGLMNSLVIDV
jgi:hypothetical protein